MIERKKILRIVQLTLLIFGFSIIYFTYYSKESDLLEKTIISKENKEKIEKQSLDKKSEEDIFYNIEYTGLDLNGNRYSIKAEETYLDKAKPEIVYMKVVKSVFYFKDDTVLYVNADKGIYNNKTLDMIFEKNVKANYLDSELFAEKAEYSNSSSYLSIYDNVRIDDIRGNLIADKLLFDITKQKLEISSFTNDRVRTNIKLNEKRF
tara:strand:- start:9 stop:629 length:621 start_codon:yes stop_codon:yes gene_type:complete